MNASISSVVTTVTLLIITPGCSGMGNFLFGRGARCGLCNRGPAFQAPQPPRPQPQTQPCQPNPCVPYQPQQPYGMTPAYPAGPCSPPCGTYGSAYGGDCQCGSAYMSDPYIGGEVIEGYPGEIMGSPEVLTEDEWERRQSQAN